MIHLHNGLLLLLKTRAPGNLKANGWNQKKKIILSEVTQIQKDKHVYSLITGLSAVKNNHVTIHKTKELNNK